MKIGLFGSLCIAMCVAVFAGCNRTSEKDSHHERHEEENAAPHAHGEEGKEAHSKDEIIFTPQQAKVAGVEIETVAASDFSQVITVTGYVMPSQGGQSTVSATMSGIVRLARNDMTEGYRIGAGQPLFYISTQVLGDGNPVAAAEAELETAKKEWERAQVLIKDNIISQKAYEASKLRYEKARSTSRSMGNGKADCVVKSPLSGYVQNLTVGNGDYVSVGQTLATVSQDRRLQLRAELPERHYGALDFIESANFRLTYQPEVVYELKKMNGRLVSGGRTVNRGEGFLPVTFEFNNTGTVVPGSLAEIYLLGRSKPGTLSIPLSALTEEMGLFYVYIRKSDHSYLKREVSKGADNGMRVEILRGLEAGDQVVTEGAIAIKLAANAGAVPDPHAGHSH